MLSDVAVLDIFEKSIQRRRVYDWMSWKSRKKKVEKEEVEKQE